MSKLANMAERIGSVAEMRVEGLSVVSLTGFLVVVEIQDAKTGYGRDRYMVTPVGGTGSAWVDSDRLTFREAQ
jgi:hypothetical protein